MYADVTQVLLEMEPFAVSQKSISILDTSLTFCCPWESPSFILLIRGLPLLRLQIGLQGIRDKAFYGYGIQDSLKKLSWDREFQKVKDCEILCKIYTGYRKLSVLLVEYGNDTCIMASKHLSNNTNLTDLDVIYSVLNVLYQPRNITWKTLKIWIKRINHS